VARKRETYASKEKASRGNLGGERQRPVYPTPRENVPRGKTQKDAEKKPEKKCNVGGQGEGGGGGDDSWGGSRGGGGRGFATTGGGGGGWGAGCCVGVGGRLVGGGGGLDVIFLDLGLGVTRGGIKVYQRVKAGPEKVLTFYEG